MAVAVLPSMKQSRLGFNAHASGGASSSRAPMMEVIVLDDSSDDELKTPPPASSKQEKEKEKGDELKRVEGDGKMLQKRSMNLQKDSATGIDQPPAKKAKADVTLEQSPHSRLFPDSEPDSSRPGEGRMCHQHRHPCSNLLQCTARKQRGYRCTMKYCYKTLAKVYKQDAGQIVSAGRNILGVKVEDHVGPSEASYLWKCPKCRGICQCSACRRQAGLEPLRIIHTNGEARKSTTDASDVEVVSVKEKVKSKKKDDGDKGKGKERESVATPTAMPSSKGEAKKRGRPKKTDNALLKNSFAKAAETTKANGSTAVYKPRVFLQQQTLPQPLHKPMEVDKPILMGIRTRLPISNIKERIWLYESLVRFDWFDIPKLVLKNLDRFDDWTEGQLQTILEKLICRVADISNIKVKPSRKIHQKLVETFRETGQDMKRGEVWEAAKKYCQHKSIIIGALQEVPLQPHQIFDEKKNRQFNNVPTETLLEGRLTRGRRLAQQRALERAKIISMREMQDSDESSLSSLEDESEADSGSENEQEEEEDEAVVKRRSRRLNPKDDEVRKTRRRGRVALPPSEPSESEDEEEIPAQANESKSESDSDIEIIGEMKADGPREAPHFEERVAILSGLVEVLMEKKAINEEITNGFKEVVLLEKAGKEEERELISEQAELLQAHSNKAPSMLEVGDFAAWKEERSTLKKKHAFALLDVKVHTYLQMEAHKSRTGPLGKDVDGNEYWQLSEYNEHKPADVTGRWAWSLLVLGNDFYIHLDDPSMPPPQSHEGREASSVKEVMEEGETKVDTKEVDIDEDFVVLIGLPVARKSPVQKIKEDTLKVKNAKTIPPEESATSKVQAEGLSIENGIVVSSGFSCTDDFKVIARLKEYVLYRLAMNEYEELLEARTAEQLEREQLMNANLEEQINSGKQGDDIVASGMSTLRAKMNERKRQKNEMIERHATRRKEVEGLIKNLEMVRMYHQWHDEEEGGKSG